MKARLLALPRRCDTCRKRLNPNAVGQLWWLVHGFGPDGRRAEVGRRCRTCAIDLDLGLVEGGGNQ